jgi:hypothetical protein
MMFEPTLFGFVPEGKPVSAFPNHAGKRKTPLSRWESGVLFDHDM